MSQLQLEDRSIFLGNMQQQLRITLTSILNNSYALADRAFSMEDVCSLIRHFWDSWGLRLAGPLRLMQDTKWNSVALSEWLDRVREYQGGEALEGWLDINDDLTSLVVWEHKFYQEHWVDSLICLQSWWFWGFPEQVVSVRWQASDRYIEVIVTGVAKDAEVIEVEGGWNEKWSFWIVKMTQSEMVMVSPSALMTKLLIAQLMVQQSGGLLSVEIGEEERILVVLRIPRADAISLVDLESSLLPVDVAWGILSPVMSMVANGWLSMGNHLLEMLMEKMPQLEKSPEKRVIKQVGRLQKGCEKLVSLLQTLEKEVVNWKVDGGIYEGWRWPNRVG